MPVIPVDILAFNPSCLISDVEISFPFKMQFFEKIISAFSYFQKYTENKRIPPDFLSILWKILIRQQELYGLILNQNIINIMVYDFQILNKTNEEIEIENKILNLYH